MAFPLLNTKLFNFYRRYKWTAQNFTDLQDTLYNYPAMLLSNMALDAVLNGFNPNGSSSLTVNYLAGTAINVNGQLLALSSGGSVACTNNVNSLIVARPVVASTNNITRPTSPFDTVPLNSETTCQIVAIAGTAGVYPSKAAGDVILFGVVASAGSITLIDQSKCELFGKSNLVSLQNRYNIVVGNRRHAHYLDLASAIAAAASGDRILVRDSQALASTIVISLNDILVEFDPSVVFSAGAATTGFTLSGNGIVLRSGRVTGFTTGVNITGNYCTVDGTRFASNTTDVADSLATSQQVGVISE